MRFNLRLFFPALFVLLLAARLCHVRILWTEETLPMASAFEMQTGRTLYRDIWFDKPPLLPAAYLLIGARPGWPVRLLGAFYALLACWLAYRFARDLWSPLEGCWAAALLGFFLVFDLPSAVIPVASDLLMLAPHLVAVWLAWKRKPLWSGVAAGVAFWISPKGVFVLAACALWNPAGIPLLAAGFAAAGALACGWLWSAGALPAYWEEVWKWGTLYASAPLTAHPFVNGVWRTANWAGFHIAAVLAAAWYVARPGKEGRLRWVLWCGLCLVGVVAGLRFFPRYYFLLLAPVVLMAARGMALLGRKREFVALLLLIPVMRFGPRYVWLAAGGTEWADTLMDRDSRKVAALTRSLAHKGDTLFVWGYRPELYVYTRMPAATIFLDSQPLTGVPADRHLTEATPLETAAARTRRAELAQTHPAFVIDGLSLYNPRLAMSRYPELRAWLAQYREAGRTATSIIYSRR
ncbi:MAG TPA: hypothetical protein VKV17_11325 [Bryobacteraceae bacterium]|nr:hypothetical protein [Bryobacteraceae bacterium]